MSNRWSGARPSFDTQQGRAAHSRGSTTRLVAKGARLAHLLRHTDVEARSGGGDCSSRRRIVSSSAVATGP